MSQIKVVKVGGMSCSHCERALERALSQVVGVEAARADHQKGEVTLTIGAPVPDAALSEAITNAGYRPE